MWRHNSARISGEAFDHQTQSICTLIFLSAYALILLPIILYTGATGDRILDIQAMLGIESRAATMWVVVWSVGLIGTFYALFGGLKSVAVSDTLNSIGLLSGGLMVSWFGLSVLGEGSVSAGLSAVLEGNPGRLRSNGASESSVPFSTVFSGVLLLHFFTGPAISRSSSGPSEPRHWPKGRKGCSRRVC